VVAIELSLEGSFKGNVCLFNLFIAAVVDRNVILAQQVLVDVDCGLRHLLEVYFEIPAPFAICKTLGYWLLVVVLIRHADLVLFIL
jgi:hypothetical protein